MPEVVTRRRLGRRTGGLRFKLHRWFYRNRPEVAVSVAFVIFVLTGILVAGLIIKSTGNGPTDVEDVRGLPLAWSTPRSWIFQNPSCAIAS